MVVEEGPPGVVAEKYTPPPEVMVEEDPPRSGDRRGPSPLPPEVMVEEDPPKWWWKRTPPQGKDQARPTEKFLLGKRVVCLSKMAFLSSVFCFFVKLFSVELFRVRPQFYISFSRILNCGDRKKNKINLAQKCANCLFFH